MVSILFCMLGDENNTVKECAYFCIEKNFTKNADFIAINLQQSLKDAFEYQNKFFKQRSLHDSFYPRLYILIHSKKSLQKKFISQVTALLEPSDPSFTEFLCDILSCFPYISQDELSPILSHISTKVQTSAFRLLRTIKVRIAHKESLNHETLTECLHQAQMVLLRNYLINAYQLKNTEENSEKNIQKAENVGGFIEEYEEFKEYHKLKEIKAGEDLSKFKKKVMDM